jgi:hypothetical protein
MGNMLTKNVDYFEMFSQGIKVSLEAAQSLKAAFADGIINAFELEQISAIEEKGDHLLHDGMKIVNVAFVTPIDRIDIVNILRGIESITDSIDQVAKHIYMMRLTKSNDHLRRLVDLTVCSCETLCELMVALKRFKKHPQAINDLIVKVNDYEEEGDAEYAQSMLDLFDTETDAIEIVKNKELYQLLEHTLDLCEDVANIVDDIMIAKT